MPSPGAEQLVQPPPPPAGELIAVRTLPSYAAFGFVPAAPGFSQVRTTCPSSSHQLDYHTNINIECSHLLCWWAACDVAMQRRHRSLFPANDLSCSKAGGFVTCEPLVKGLASDCNFCLLCREWLAPAWAQAPLAPCSHASVRAAAQQAGVAALAAAAPSVCPFMRRGNQMPLQWQPQRHSRRPWQHHRLQLRQGQSLQSP